MASKDLVAPRNEQPNPVSEWPGHISNKFTTNKKHLPEPIPDQNAAHPIYSMGGRRHFEEREAQKPQTWKPSLKCGIAPQHRQPNKEAVKHIDFVPGQIKESYEKRHLRDKFDSLTGPTHDNPNLSIRAFEQANARTNKEWATE